MYIFKQQPLFAPWKIQAQLLE
jgi:hypothetical protein